MPKEIRVWETFDGCLFPTEAEAEAYEAEKQKQKQKKIRDFVNAHGWSPMSIGGVADMLINNLKELKETLFVPAAAQAIAFCRRNPDAAGRELHRLREERT